MTDEPIDTDARTEPLDWADESRLWQMNSMVRLNARKRAEWRAFGMWCSAVVTVGVFWALYWYFDIRHVAADALNYSNIYFTGGGYLARNNRDPGFVWIVRRALDVFGWDGFEKFQLAVMLIMSFVAAMTAVAIRATSRLSLAAVLIPVSALTSLSLVQIREGCGFLCLLLAALLASRARQNAWWILAIGIILAIAIHLGLAVFIPAWVLACAVAVMPSPFTRRKLFWRLVTATGLLIGVVVSLEFLRNPGAAKSSADAFINTSGEVLTGFWKYPNSLCNGILVLAVRQQAVKLASERMGFLWRCCGLVERIGVFTPAGPERASNFHRKPCRPFNEPEMPPKAPRTQRGLLEQ